MKPAMPKPGRKRPVCPYCHRTVRSVGKHIRKEHPEKRD